MIQTKMKKRGLNYTGHVSVFILLFFVLMFLNYKFEIFQINYQTYLLLFLIGIFYSLLPDIDTFESTMGKVFLISGFILISFCLIYKETVLGILILTIMAFFSIIKHRGFIHSIFAAIIFSLPLLLIGIEFFFVGLISFISHLLADKKIKLF